jgi:hypothetical protein
MMKFGSSSEESHVFPFANPPAKYQVWLISQSENLASTKTSKKSSMSLLVLEPKTVPLNDKTSSENSFMYAFPPSSI